jgi:hypothetical protein
MKISGFTMVKNADKLYYPIKQSIESMLPIVDEFIVALGDNDEDDHTLAIIESIDSDKVKIIRTVWDLNKYPNGMENAHQTDIAKNACSGDWVFYLQADEVINEKDHTTIIKRCEEFLDDDDVEGLLFKYYHFWGDYNHYHTIHGWYKNEIRIVKNKPEIHSWESAQSFRRIPEFDGVNYRVQAGTHKLKVAQVDAHVYHYGWVRPPHLMQKKKKSLDTIHKGVAKAEEMYSARENEFDYGPMDLVPLFQGTHPNAMKNWIADFNWSDKLNYSKELKHPNDSKLKHIKKKIRLITWLENLIGKEIGGFKNYILLKK